MTLDEFKAKLKEYEANNVQAFMGTIKITQNERDDLMRMLKDLSAKDQAEAKTLLKSKGVDA